MATARGAEGAGRAAGAVDQVAAAGPRSGREQVTTLRRCWAARLERQTVWNRLDGHVTMPHLIPADSGHGLEPGPVLYENAVIFAGPPNGQAQPRESSRSSRRPR